MNEGGPVFGGPLASPILPPIGFGPCVVLLVMVSMCFCLYRRRLLSSWLSGGHCRASFWAWVLSSPPRRRWVGGMGNWAGDGLAGWVVPPRGRRLITVVAIFRGRGRGH